VKELKMIDVKCSENWRDEYKKKLVSAEEAVKVVKSGDRVVLPWAPTTALATALAARSDELRDVEIHSSAPGENLSIFFQPQMEKVFSNTLFIYAGPMSRVAPRGLDSKAAQFCPGTFSEIMKPFDERPDECPYKIDVVMQVVSPPDDKGFCSFGANLWNSRSYAKRSRNVIVEVDENLIRTCGTNFIHVSEIDYFVENTPPPLTDKLKEDILAKADLEVRKLVEPVIPHIEKSSRLNIVQTLCQQDVEAVKAYLAGRMYIGDPPPEALPIARNVGSLLNDRDTFQIGGGTMGFWLIACGAFDGKKDLSVYTEMCSPRMGYLMQKGIVTGKYKKFHPGKFTCSTFRACYADELEFFHNNLACEQIDAEYLLDIRTISQNDNFVAINCATSVDLTGQINSETGVGSRLINGHGGQPEMHMGAILSEGGKALTLLPSTRRNGTISAIVPQLDQGAVVTIPRYFADYIITEYGIARLNGLDCRQRAEALIKIAHPNFRDKLAAEAKKLFYP
jgi:4-hydroxybutyrate CoA-transferase